MAFKFMVLNEFRKVFLLHCFVLLEKKQFSFFGIFTDVAHTFLFSVFISQILERYSNYENSLFTAFSVVFVFRSSLDVFSSFSWGSVTKVFVFPKGYEDLGILIRSVSRIAFSFLIYLPVMLIIGGLHAFITLFFFSGLIFLITLATHNLTKNHKKLRQLVNFGLGYLVFATPVLWPFGSGGWRDIVALLNPFSYPVLFEEGILKQELFYVSIVGYVGFLAWFFYRKSCWVTFEVSVKTRFFENSNLQPVSGYFFCVLSFICFPFVQGASISTRFDYSAEIKRLLGEAQRTL